MLWPTTRPEHAQVEKQERPRLLFRKVDLPTLKARAATPFGQAALAKMNDGVGLGIRYQLGGDPQLAEAAARWVEERMAGRAPLPAVGMPRQSMQMGWFFEEVALTYDLCAEAWPADVRRRVRHWMILWANRLAYQKTMFNPQVSWDHGAAEAGNLYHGTALGGLALWGEKGGAPAAPLAPDLITSIEPAAGYKPGRGVPVVKLEPGTPPKQWLYSTPADSFAEGDPLADLGGTERARPEEGSAFMVEGQRCVFKPLPLEHVLERGGIILNVGRSLQPATVKREPGPEIKADGPLLIAFYTVLDNEKPRHVKVVAPSSAWGRPQVVINGHRMEHGQVIMLDKGLYPYLIVLRLSARWNTLETPLTEASVEEVAGNAPFLKQLEAEHAERLRDHALLLADHQRTGGAAVDAQKIFEMGRYQMYLQCREGLGAGGPARYAFAHRTAFGRLPSPYADIAHTLPRKVFAAIDAPAPATQPFATPGAADFAFGYAIAPDPWKPALLWAWNRAAHITGPADAAKALEGDHPSLAAWAFLTYPLDGIEPAPPKGILPLTWSTLPFGQFGFRNTFDGKDDILLQVWANTSLPHENNLPGAGAIHLRGLGHAWAPAALSPHLRRTRAWDGVVQLPDDAVNESALGRITFARQESDGSGAVSIDLADLYATAKKDSKGNPLPLYERYGGARRTENFASSNITALRAVAIDFSGRSGAPALLAIADRITGGKKKVWTWPLDPRVLNDPKAITIEGNTCTLRKPDGATLHLTVIAPAHPILKADARTNIPTLSITGPTGVEGDFLIILTLQKGPPPKVRAEGQGLQSSVTVGNQRIVFEGGKLTVGP